MKRAELSLGVLAAVILALIGVTLSLLFLTQTTAGTTYYCQSLGPLLERLGAPRSNLCERIVPIEFTLGERRLANLSTFPNGNTRLLARIGAQPVTFDVPIRNDAQILNATFIVENGNEQGYITRFSGHDQTTVLTFDFNGGDSDVYLNMTNDIIISKAKLKMQGYNVPGAIDLVFVIDQSGSMKNEWNDICSNIRSLRDNLSRTGLGVDVISTIYGLSDASAGRTSGSCRTADISDAQLDQSASQMGVTLVKAAPVPISFDTYDYGAFDNYFEAWAQGTFWAVNSHPWRENTKRVIFPVSDSDPTGGGPRVIQFLDQIPIAYLAEPLFTGNEGPSISAAKNAADAAGVYIFPIYGDEPAGLPPAQTEGYHVGTGPTTCDPNIDPNCGCAPAFQGGICTSVIDWMRQLAQPNSKVAAYRNPDELKKFAQNVLTTNFPHDVQMKVGNRVIYTNPGPLDDTNSPIWIDEQAFIDALQAEIDSCSAAPCDIPVTFSSTTEGALVLTDLEIEYQRIIRDLQIDVGSTRVLDEPRFTGRTWVNFTAAARSLVEGCTLPDCPIDFTIRASSNDAILLSNLSIRYRRFFVEEDLADLILSCQEEAQASAFREKRICGELTIPAAYPFPAPINEERITDIISARQFCHFIANSDFGCGTKDQLRFTQSFTSPTNLLIEFDPASQQVVVS